MIRIAFTVIFGLALLAFGMMLMLARPAEAQELACVPYDIAISLIEQSGGKILGEITVPQSGGGTVLYFVDDDGIVWVSGVLGDHVCVHAPSTRIGPWEPVTPA
jgi:hypothetical protein